MSTPNETPSPARSRRWTAWAGPAVGVLGVAIAIPALVLAATANRDSAPSCSVPTVARNELPSVVTISVATAGGGGTGSGEVIDTSGHILTNNHVISAAAGGGTITVIFNNGRTQTARLVGRDIQTDLAVLQVPQPQGLRPIRFGSSEQITVGQSVIALGAPLGLSNTVTAGIVSARDRSVNVPADNDTTALLVAAIQTDAAINPGNSGGALVDCAGKLIGVPTAGAVVPSPGGGSAGDVGIGFAIPSDFAHRIAQELISDGRANHGFFGVNVATVSDGQTSGLFVVSVTADGPGAQAGLQSGDVITSINGTQAVSAEQLLSLTLTHTPGSTVAVQYQRDGQVHQATITLGSG